MPNHARVNTIFNFYDNPFPPENARKEFRLALIDALKRSTNQGEVLEVYKAAKDNGIDL